MKKIWIDHHFSNPFSVEAHDGRPLKLFVYNSDTDTCRDVVVTANSAWGGDGLLGCGIGYGLLHRIPTEVREHATHETPTLPPPSNPPAQNNPAPTQLAATYQNQTQNLPQQAPYAIQNQQNYQQTVNHPQSVMQNSIPQVNTTTQINQINMSNPLAGLPDISNLGITPGLQNLANQPVPNSQTLPSATVTNIQTTVPSTQPLNNLSNTFPDLNLGNLPPLNLPNLNLNAAGDPQATPGVEKPVIPAQVPAQNLNANPPLQPVQNVLPTSTIPGLENLNLGNLNLNMPASVGVGQNLPTLSSVPGLSLPPLNLPNLNTTTTVGALPSNLPDISHLNLSGIPPLNLNSKDEQLK